MKNEACWARAAECFHCHLVLSKVLEDIVLVHLPLPQLFPNCSLSQPRTSVGQVLSSLLGALWWGCPSPPSPPQFSEVLSLEQGCLVYYDSAWADITKYHSSWLTPRNSFSCVSEARIPESRCWWDWFSQGLFPRLVHVFRLLLLGSFSVRLEARPLLGFCQLDTNLESPGTKERQFRKCLYQTGLQASL